MYRLLIAQHCGCEKQPNFWASTPRSRCASSCINDGIAAEAVCFCGVIGGIGGFCGCGDDDATDDVFAIVVTAFDAAAAALPLPLPLLLDAVAGVVVVVLLLLLLLDVVGTGFVVV